MVVQRSTKDINEEDLIRIVLRDAFYVHSILGAGLLESAYQKCLAYRLRLNGLFVEEEKPVLVVFEEVKLECGYRADLVVEGKLIVEHKAVDELAQIHTAQLLTHLKFLKLRYGLLLNFNTVHLKDGIKRVLRGMRQSHNPFMFLRAAFVCLCVPLMLYLKSLLCPTAAHS